MKTLLHFKILFLIMALPAIALANGKFKGKYTKEKKLSKEYSVSADANLEIDNSYGNVDIVTWNQNRIVIEVTIKTNGNNEEKVVEKLEDITVDFSGSSSQVTAKTRFGSKRNNNWSFWGNNNSNVSMEINYSIKMPKTNSVNINNDYGGINITSLSGRATINCDYGQLNIGELLASDNSLNFDYTNNSTIGYMKSGRINADYSGYTLEKAERVEIRADYTKSEVLDAQLVNFYCDYGKMDIKKVKDLVGRGNYIPSRIETVTGSVDLQSDYGSIHIERATSSAKNITINAEYAGIKIGFDSGYNFDFELDLSYAGFSGEDEVTITQRDEKSFNKKYAGYRGSKNSGNLVSIDSDYGSVSFK